MKRFAILFLASVLGVSGFIQARVHSNKSFMAVRPHNQNIAIEYATWHKQFRDTHMDRFGGALQISDFYQVSTNKTDLGKYFGMYNSITNQIQDYIEVKDRGADSTALALLLDSRSIIHNPKAFGSSVGEIEDVLDAKGAFRPSQESYGVRFSYHQRLDQLAQGTFFKVSTVLEHVKNDLGLSYEGSRLNQKLPNGSTGEREVSLADYLAGRVENTYTKAQQKKLTHAKICGADSVVGFADVEMMFGYNFLYAQRHPFFIQHAYEHLNANVSLTIPTGGKSKGERLFEARVGNNGHWAVGCGIDGAFELWKHEHTDISLDMLLALHYKYFLNATERRTVGFKYPNEVDNAFAAGKRIGLGFYSLGGKKGEMGVFPLANVLTQEVGVEPGSSFEVLLSFAYNYHGWTFDIGYNVFAKETESVSIKSWADDTYAIANHNYDTNNVFDPNDSTTSISFPIQREHLLPQDTATSGSVTHKVFGGIGYTSKDWECPLMIGLGTSWEFVQGSNSALNGYALWSKLGLAF